MNPTLETLPERMRHLKIDKRGYPVPWFVAWVNGEPEFRAMDADKWKRAVRDSRCWVCGGSLYQQELCFVIGQCVRYGHALPPRHTHRCAASIAQRASRHHTLTAGNGRRATVRSSLSAKPNGEWTR